MSYQRFTMKLHQVFSVHPTLEELKRRINQPVILDLCLRKAQSEKSYDYGYAIVSEKLRIQIVFRPHENAKPAL